MNFLNLLTKEKRVAGIEISDSVVRIAFFRPNKRKESSESNTPKEELVLIEESIAANIIADGIVLDVELLGNTLKGIWEKAKLGTDYAIVAIPDDKIYSRIFSFPKSVEGMRLTEAMRLAISFQLPIKIEDAYLDWERVQGTSTVNEILLSTIPRTVAQGYVTALEMAGIKTLALESHLAAIARAVKLKPKEITLFTKKTPDGATIFALEDGILRFSRTLPSLFVPEDQISKEIEKVKVALEADTKKPVSEDSLLDASICDEYAMFPSISDPKSKWLIPLGAAIRGKIPEGEDNLVSLLPVGTEEAYAYQKATTMISLIRNMTIGVSLFFIIAFLGAYLFVFSLSQNSTQAIATLSAGAVPPELLAKEARINNINAITNTASELLAKTPLWSTVLDELQARITDGITVSSVSLPGIAEKFSLTGVAHDRAVLNLFKKSLQESAMFSEVDLPITNLEQKELIPFSVSFRLKDPTAIYYK